MQPTARFLLAEFDQLSDKDKVEVLIDIVSNYGQHIKFAQLSGESERRLWAPHYSKIAQDYFGDKSVTK